MNTAAVEIDLKQYGKLLARTLPTVVRTEAENQRLTAELKELDGRYHRRGKGI